MAEKINWVLSHYQEIASLLVAIVALAEAVTRLTPTKDDDGFVSRVGKLLDQALKFLPNNIRKDVQQPTENTTMEKNGDGSSNKAS